MAITLPGLCFGGRGRYERTSRRVKELLERVNVSPELAGRIVTSLVILLVLWLIKTVACALAKRRAKDQEKFYHWRRLIVYAHTFLGVILIGRIWIEGIDSLATFLGLAGAGIAVAMHDTISNIAGWAFIVWRKPFEVGDRIEIGGRAGDVIDVRFLQFSLIEIGNWVDAEQSTGRIIHVPNSMTLREPISNYETGFRYIWHEIPVLITFESNWEEAKRILSAIAAEKAEHLSEGAEAQIRRAAGKYLIHIGKLTPIVYTTVKASGVLLTIRYIVKPRVRRGSEEAIWEAILRAFAEHDDITLAYPTTRFYEEPAARRGE